MANQRRSILTRLRAEGETLGTIVTERFLVQPCPRCHEASMRFIEISPNARSMHYSCVHCNKKMHAPAGTPTTSEAIDVLANISALIDEYNSISGPDTMSFNMTFDTPAAPLPYEQTTRSPISEAVRSEVWRRDSGACVQCNSKENLHFDHIIPVSRGGATSVRNLQLLCEQCNIRKGARI
jgi:hypothetical protein